MPCKEFAELAKESHLLIHEATMEDDLWEEARIKRHSTISQAIDMRVKSQSNFTLLTHFSQRYSKLPKLPDPEHTDHDFSRIGVAYDFMTINLSKLKLLPLLLPSLNIIFSEFREQLEQKALKREWRKEMNT